MDYRQINICIPTYERVDMTIDAFLDVYSDARIKNIIIVDDCSSMETYNELKSLVEHFPKVLLYRNEKNLDCYFNKKEAISKSTTDYCIILDSDNKINTDYIDAIYNEQWDSKTVYCPSFAKPNFNYRQFSGLEITKHNVNDYLDENMFQTALNTFNCFINKDEYLKVWDGTTNPVTSDSIYFMYCWMKSGNAIKIVDGMQYHHEVHSGSHYVNNVHRTGNFNEILIDKIRELN